MRCCEQPRLGPPLEEAHPFGNLKRTRLLVLKEAQACPSMSGGTGCDGHATGVSLATFCRRRIRPTDSGPHLPHDMNPAIAEDFLGRATALSLWFVTQLPVPILERFQRCCLN